MPPLSQLLGRMMTGRGVMKDPRRTRRGPLVESLEGRVLLANLLANGDFELGNTGFTTQYPNTDTAGGYIIGHNPAVDRLAGFLSFGDHTTGTGLMNQVDGAFTPNQTVWQETVSVSPNTDYTFSGWSASMLGPDPSPARLRFVINGAQIGSDYQVPAQGGSWSQFSATWNSGTAGIATIQIFDQNTEYAGNDFALDDLSFQAIQSASTRLVVTAQPPDIVLAGADFGLTVAAEDQFGNVDAAYHGTLTVALASNPGGAILGGELTATAQDGVATFSGLTLDQVGVGYTLTVSNSGLIPATTGTFDVAPAAPQAVPPIVVGFRYVGSRHQPTTLVLTFSEPMNSAQAEDRAAYRLVWAGRDRRLGTRDDRVIPIRSVRYDAASQSVVLRPVRGLPPHRTFWLTVDGTAPGGLTSASGIPLDGAATGRPGSDYVVHFDRNKVLASSSEIELVRDGGFETPKIPPRRKALTIFAGENDLAPWQITSGSIDVATYWRASQGTHALDLNGTSPASIQQSFATTVGQTYRLSFDYANNPDKPTQTDIATAAVTVTGVGTRLSQEISHAGSTPRDMKYTRFLATFIADSATTTLRFASATPGAYGIVLDAVSVRAVPGAMDATPPAIQLTTAAPAGPVSENVTLAGRVTDATGVARLEAQVDSGTFQEVALDPLGQFTFTTALATDGTADGLHVVRFRAADLVGNVSPTTTESFTLVTRGTVAYWRFEEGTANLPATGTMTILDSSGNNLDGTPINGPIYRANVLLNPFPQTGETNALSLDFNGADQRVFIPDNRLFQLTRSLTLESYIYVREFGTGLRSQILMRGDFRFALDPYYIALESTGEFSFHIDGVSGSAEIRAPFPGFNEWIHIAGTLDDVTGAMKLYVNGTLRSSITTTVRPLGQLDPAETPGLGIGNIQDFRNQYFNGLIDEVRISDQALQPNQFLNTIFQPSTLVISNRL